MSGVRNSLILTLAVFTVLSSTSHASAAAGQIISGVSGNQTNGWYSSVPTIRVDSSPACPTGSSGNVSLILRTSEEGTHRVTIRSHLNSYPRLYRDDQINGTETSGEIFSCSALSEPYVDVDPEIIWQATIKLDLSSPSISIGSPANNSNVSSNNVTISGTAADAVSGLQSVTVNGTPASINSNNFSASVPVVVGLNTLTAVVKDNAGHTSQSQIVINRTTQADTQSDDQDNSTGSTSNNNDIQTQLTKEESNQDNTNKQEEVVSTPAKVAIGAGAAGAAGIGVASYFGLIPYRKIGEFLVQIIHK